MSIDTNCFRINGLNELQAEYRLFQIIGLRPDSQDFYGNIQRIVRQLSFQMRAPVTTYDRNGDTFLVVPKGFGSPPDHITLVGVVATLKDTGETMDLDFETSDPELDPVRIRFLQFAFQHPLWKNPELWQPGSGKPFFFKQPAKQLGSIDLFEGFALRVMLHPEGGFGVTIDLRRKLVARSALSQNISRDQVNKLKGRSCVYRMGHNWFEVSLSGLADRHVGEPSIPLDGRVVSLADYLHTKAPKPVPASIANLRPEGSAIYYRTNGPNQNAAPAELCYLVEDTHGREGARHQPETTIAPDERYQQINRVVKRFLGDIRLGNTVLSVTTEPGKIHTRSFSVPTLRFGNDTTLARSQTERSLLAAVQEYARRRLDLLSDSDAGFYVRSRLGRQHFILPKSIANSSGSQFMKDLKAQVEALYSDGGGYDPVVVEYDDLNSRRDFVGQSRAIKEAVDAAGVKPGYALVMVHRYDRRARSADQLAAWAVKEFARHFDVTASVIHTDVIRRAYGGVTRDGETQYLIQESERKRLLGYLRNVALNKILLTNGKWPFVLETPLHADVVIGIDVKNSTAAFTLIANGGKIIRFATSPSRQKEQLLKNQVAKFVSDMLRKEAAYLNKPPKNIVIHRDGRAWPSEIAGLKEACNGLAAEGVLDSAWQLTVLEISKSSPAPLRLFYVRPANGGRWSSADNPVVGTWAQVTGNEGYVCTTGKPFRIPGTANPLHVRRVHGSMPLENCLSDVFLLSCLTWPRPEGAMRLPISIKLCDRNLFEEAADYDEDAVEFDNDDAAGAAR